MRTEFTDHQLKDPDIARSNAVLRTCVHCGFCIATCPTYQLLGDELDSPRGRIYLIKDMLEKDRPADEKTVKHIDRCLSCLACMTSCPSGVHYMHLIDHARAHIEKTYRRPLMERILRWMLARILPYPARFRLALKVARFVKPLRRVFPDKRLQAMLKLAPVRIPKPEQTDAPSIIPAAGICKRRVALLTGCAQRVLNPAINAATIRLLTRLGCEVVIAKNQGCCGALVHHMGKGAEAHDAAIGNIKAWSGVRDEGGLDAILINTSGCGTVVKDYGHMLRQSRYAEDAAWAAAMACDISEFLIEHGLPSGTKAPKPLRVAYHSACSLQHGQKVVSAPKTLLKKAGFEVVEPKDAHLCCGSAGVYNILQPTISEALKRRKCDTLKALKPDLIAAGNIGCMTQIGDGLNLPIVHTVELLDWATGGPIPLALEKSLARSN